MSDFRVVFGISRLDVVEHHIGAVPIGEGQGYDAPATVQVKADRGMSIILGDFVNGVRGHAEAAVRNGERPAITVAPRSYDEIVSVAVIDRVR